MSPPSRWTAARPRASWRPYKIATLAAVVLALFGITLAWVLRFPHYYPRPRFLPLVVYEYRAGIPARPWARQDAESLQRLRCWSNNTESLTGQTRELLLDKLRHLDSADPGEPLVVYLSGYVVPDERGEPHLLPGDARLDQKETWLPLRDALGYLVKCPARRKLLLLDVMQPLFLPAEGLLRGDVADRAWPLLQQAVDRDENLLILTACSPGQLPLASEELGHSAFVYYLLDGLRGGGDGKLAETRVDGRVTVHELAAYVTERVDAWADHSLLVRQTPFLLGGAAGFPLSSNRRDQGKDDDPLPEEYPGWLGDGWKLRDRWWKDGIHRRAPRAFAELERGLLQQEGRWRAGVVAERVREDFEMILAGVKRKQGQSAPADPAPPASLAEARARKPDLLTAQDAESVADLRRLLARRDRLAEGKPDEAAAKQLTGEVEAFVKKYEKRHVTLALLACETLCEHAVGPEGVKLLADQLRVGDAVEFTEVRFLDRLARRAKAQPGHYSARVAQLAMQAVREAAQTAVASPEVAPWIRGQLARGAQLVTAGEALLFESQEPWAEPAKKVYGEAYDLYRALNGEIRTLEEAHRCRDDALALLPGYLGALEIDDHYTDAWRRAADTARDLRQALLTPLATPGVERSERLALLGRLTDSLRNDPNSLHMLRQPLSAAGFSALIEQRKAARAADCKKWQVMLATPWPSAPQRLALWSAYRTCSRLLHDECAAAHTGAGRKLPTLRRWDDQAAKDGRTQLLRHDLLRARCAFSRLQLSDPHGLADLGRAIDEAQRHPDDPARWRALGDALKRAAARPDPAEAP